jgi:chemotaxis protein CheC
MVLNERQNDALTELLNIAFARTGAALSDLTGHRVLLETPRVALHLTTELAEALARFVPGEVASIHQVFHGPVAGDALLLLNYDGAVHLTELLTDETSESSRLDESAREVLTEVGNILLNACLGVFGNVLNVRVGFSVPRLRLDSVGDLIDWLNRGSTELRYALVVYTRFQIKDSEVNGYLVLVLNMESFERLVRELDAWAEEDGNGRPSASA